MVLPLDNPVAFTWPGSTGRLGGTSYPPAQAFCPPPLPATLDSCLQQVKQWPRAFEVGVLKAVPLLGCLPVPLGAEDRRVL